MNEEGGIFHDSRVDWVASWLFIAASILSGIATVYSAAHADFFGTAIYFAAALQLFDIHLKNQDCIAMLKRMEAK
jgi:hypothetical protein